MNHAILWQSPQKWKNENQDVWVSAFQNANCNAMYLFWESPCRNWTFIWHFEMLIKCNANISILGAMQNANVMQMKCNTNKCEKMHNSGSNQIRLFPHGTKFGVCRQFWCRLCRFRSLNKSIISLPGLSS